MFGKIQNFRYFGSFLDPQARLRLVGLSLEGQKFEIGMLHISANLKDKWLKFYPQRELPYISILVKLQLDCFHLHAYDDSPNLAFWPNRHFRGQNIAHLPKASYQR